MGVRAKFTLAGTNEEGKKQPLSGQIAFKKEVGVHELQASLFSCSFPSESLCLNNFSTLHFHGHFLHVGDSKQFRSMMFDQEINGTAIRVPSILKSSMNNYFLLHGRCQKKLVSALTKWSSPGVCVLAGGWHIQPHKTFLPHDAIYLCMSLLQCAEGQTEPVTDGCNREVQAEELH